MQSLKSYIYANSDQMVRKPQGLLKHPYLVPSAPDSPFYSMMLWDWDSWQIGIVMGQVEADTGKKGTYLDSEIGTVLNFIEHMDDDGYMPIGLHHEDADPIRKHTTSSKDDTNMHKPIVAQHSASIIQRHRDIEWLRPFIPKLELFINRYLINQTDSGTGLAYWKDDLAVGVDNDPSVFYRPDNSCGSIYLNSLLYRELLCMGYILEEAGDMQASIKWRNKAQDLADAVNTYCWDERDGTYYSVDFALRPVKSDASLHSGAPRDYPCLLMRIDNWSSFLPMWAGIASSDRAARMVERYREERTFNCRGGIRTLSRLEKTYDIRASNNPSNWRGPVWGNANFFLFDGLLKYGYLEDAQSIAEKTINMFGRDLEINGSLHEYYNPDTCEPIITHGFQNWNFLVLNMIAFLEDREYITMA